MTGKPKIHLLDVTTFPGQPKTSVCGILHPYAFCQRIEDADCIACQERHQKRMERASKYRAMYEEAADA